MRRRRAATRVGTLGVRPGPRPNPRDGLESYGFLEGLMARYTTEHLVSGTPRSFEERIRAFLDVDDPRMEGFDDPSRQRDLSIRFHWGHDHDFGTFRLPGQMRDRHVWLLATFMDRFGALPRSLEGVRVLDVGCWTGGTSLLLAAMGAEVVAIEEVRKYVDAVTFVASSFGVDNLEARHASLYECRGPGYDDAFDLVLFAGVLYHVSDPILALRTTFNCLADGGSCLVETLAVDAPEPVLGYRGARAVTGASAGTGARGGWNWFVPSPTALEAMIRDVGFQQARVSPRPTSNRRAFAVATRERHVDMLRAGLSAPIR